MYVSDDTASAARTELRRLARELRLVTGVADLCYWDERTKLPVGGQDWRAEQRAVMAGIVHERATSPELARAIDAVEQEEAGDSEARVMRRDLERATRLPLAFVQRHAATVSAARAAWDTARRADDFTPYAPHLAKLVDEAREEAELHGYEVEPYDAMLGLYEPGMSSVAVADLFDQVAAAATPLLDAVAAKGTTTPLLDQQFDVAAQWEFERRALHSVCFDATRGRVDGTPRAFCIRLAPHDVRMTTRFHEDPTLQVIGSTLHEAGHAVYAQSFARLGVPETLAVEASVGVDESQSRMIEVFVAGGTEWWSAHMPELARLAGGRLAKASADDLVREYRLSEARHQRIGSDEVAYNLHVLVRFEIERALVNGDLRAHEVPDVWNARMADLFGTPPAGDAAGCLQDVHWSIGQWGYFPTYMLGNVYAAQLLEAARRDLPDLDAELAATGSTRSLVAWFDQHLYRYGRMRDGAATIEHATGQPPSADALIRHLRSRYA